MNRRLFGWTRSAFWGCAIVLLVCLAVRLLWRAAEMETGIQSLVSHWRDATIGWVVGDHEPIYLCQPIEQADYWLREANRVLDADPNDAQLTMGAALVLDSPGDGYVWRYVKRLNTYPEFGTFPDYDIAEIKRAEDAFEKRCRQRCLELAATAAKLAPTNVEWWRLYALLLRRDSVYACDDTPRDPDWLSILDDCARHDPDNALYDYLAAWFYWQAAAEMDFSGGEERLVIKDGDKFKRGIARFEQGQAKHCFAFGDMGYTAVADFLSHTQAPLNDHERIVNSRGIHLRRSVLLRDTWRWQGYRESQRASAGDPASALMLSRQNRHLIDQYEMGGASTAYDQVAMACKKGTSLRMQKFAGALHDAKGNSERQQIVAIREAEIIQREVVKCAATDLASGKIEPPTAFCGAFLFLADALIVGVAPSLVVLLVLFGFPVTVMSRRLADGGLPVVGPVGQLSTLAVAIATTAVLFGLAPAEIIGRPIQSWLFTAGLLLAPIVLVPWIGCWLRRRTFRFSVLTVLIFILILTLLASLFFSLVFVGRLHRDFFSSFPFPLSVPALGWKGVDAAVCASTIAATYGQWPWAVFQWTAYYGPYLTLVLWACLLVALHCRKMGRMQREEGARLPDLRQRFSGLLRSLGRPALVMSALMLFAYLLLAPGILEQAEQEFQKQMAFARNPQTHWTAVAEAVQRVHSDEKTMGELREVAKREAATPTAPDSVK